jgi:LPPG:FO 2-phospho-L-lactate transferase
VHFQEWWVRMHAEVAATHIVLAGAPGARPAPGVVEAIQDSDVVLLPPSNPVVSVGAILSVPGIGEAVRTTRAPVVGLSPIVGGAPVRGMADACLAAIGVETSATAVAYHYGRRPDGLLDGWLVDDADKAAADDLAADGWPARAVPLMMTDVDTTAAMAAAALELAAELRR